MPTASDWSSRARRALLHLDRDAVLGLVVVGIVVLVVVGVLTWQARPRELKVVGDGSPLGSSTGSGTPVGPASSSPDPPGSAPLPTGQIVVDVVGRVRRPGLATLAAGARVADAVAAVGGFIRTRDARLVNQARVVADGEQVVVARGGASPPGVLGAAVPGAAGPAGSGAEALVDLNAATIDQLEGLPGVGPVLAQRILEHRASIGRFSSVDQLLDVSGIGDATFGDLSPRVRV